ADTGRGYGAVGSGVFEEDLMATTKQKKASGLSTADKKKPDDKQFAFPNERKEPLVDATHVRNAVARFDQVEGVTDNERDRAWRRIEAAAKKFGVDLEEKSWHELFSGGKTKKAKKATKAKKKK
ncbi:MAG TPA: DUF6582 domain-containing protein, partial [Acidimicrobiales bacterium]